MFLEVSQLSFVEGLGPKFREGMILKRTGSKEPGRAGCNFCGLLDSTICVRYYQKIIFDNKIGLKIKPKLYV